MTDHERCAECGFDGGAFDDERLVDAVAALGRRWRALIAIAGGDLRTRPAPGVWSALEYVAHSRDITALHVFGVEQALTVDEPRYPAFEEGLADKAAADYNHENVDEVLDALDTEARRLAALAPGGWRRGLTTGDRRQDVRGLVEHALHDSTHHLQDVERGLAEISEKR